MWNNEPEFEKLVGAKVRCWKLLDPKYHDEVKLYLADGRSVSIQLYDECCSSSYFTDPFQFDELVGATIQKVEDRAGETPPNAGPCTQEVTRWHFLVFITNRGHVTIDWRNDSNGYYDGDVLVTVHDR